MAHRRGDYSILRRCRRTGKRRAHHFHGHLPVPGRSLAGVRRDAHRRAAAVGGFLHHQRQPALDPRLARRRSGRTATRGLRLRRQLRRVPDHRRAARRPVWPPPAVPDRHGRLPRHQHAVRPCRYAVAARDRPRPAGHLRRHDGAAGARLDPDAVPERRRTLQGAQLLWRDDGSCRLDRPVRRRRAGRVEPVRPRLAHRVPRQAADRHPGDAGRLADGAGDQRQPPPAARHRRRGAGVAGAGLPGAAAVRGPPAGLARLDVRHARRGAVARRGLPVVRGPDDRARRQPAARPRPARHPELPPRRAGRHAVLLHHLVLRAVRDLRAGGLLAPTRCSPASPSCPTASACLWVLWSPRRSPGCARGC